MVTLHNGAEAQFHSSGATVAAALPLSLQNGSRSERLYLLMLTAAGNVEKKNQYDSKRRHTQRGKEEPSVWKSAVSPVITARR